MKKLQSRVNLIPVIAKSDTLTTAEIKKLKAKVETKLLNIQFFFLELRLKKVWLFVFIDFGWRPKTRH